MKTIHERPSHKQVGRRSPYKKLSKAERKVVDYMRRHLAENLSAANGIPLDQALNSIIALHDAGYLTLLAKDGRLMLVPSLDGKALDGVFLNFDDAHRDVGGRA